jgi:hypothetical protein
LQGEWSDWREWGRVSFRGRQMCVFAGRRPRRWELGVSRAVLRYGLDRQSRARRLTGRGVRV